MTEKIIIDKCWCGSKNLDIFSEYYLRCRQCNTLVCKTRMTDEFFYGGEDFDKFYGKEYWTRHVKEEYGFPDIFERSRNDLSERCIFWIRDILKYKLPPAKTLELGCAHGGLVFLMKLAGFDAAGTEMSQWVCNYAHRIFDIPMLCGRIEELDIIPQTYDIVLMMDVLEHMTDPAGALGIIEQSLKDDGIVIIQTACWRETKKTYEAMKIEKSPFLVQLKEKEHLYLFNENSIKRILNETGFPYIAFEPQIFPYDMFVIAGKHPLIKNEEASIAEELQKSPEKRTVLALIDVYSQVRDVHTQLVHRDQLLAVCEADRAARLKVINEANKNIEQLNSQILAREKILKKQFEELYKMQGNLSHSTEIFKTNRIDFGTEDATVFLRSGWSYNETFPSTGHTYNWALGNSASLLLSLPKNAFIQMKVTAKSLQFREPQIITITIDGKKIGGWRLSGHNELQEYSIVIPPDEERPDVSIVEFLFSQYYEHPSEPRKLAVLFESLIIK